MLRTALLFLFRRVARIYFRSIEVAGEVPRPDTGGRLFAANHVNGLVDPVLVLTQAPCVISPVAKSTLWKIPGLRWLLDAASAVPIVRRRDVPDKSEADNDAVFARVAEHLAGGGNILIFPEGTSHNQPHLLSLRSGAGRMLARAAGVSGVSGPLTFQAVALEFDARDVFRSRALVLFGPVRAVRDHPTADGITAQLRSDLSELLIEGASWDERMLVVRLAEVLADAGRSLEDVNRIGRRIESARALLVHSDPAEVVAIEDALRAYGARLDEADASDADVRRADGGDSPAALSRVASMMALLPLAAFASVVYWLPYQVPRLVTSRRGGDPDEASTYKLAVGLVVYPLWALLAAAAAVALLPSAWAIAAIAALLSSPFAALPWLDHWDRIPRLLAPSEQRRDQLAELALQRASLVARIESVRRRLEANDPSMLSARSLGDP